MRRDLRVGVAVGVRVGVRVGSCWAPKTQGMASEKAAVIINFQPAAGKVIPCTAGGSWRSFKEGEKLAEVLRGLLFWAAMTIVVLVSIGAHTGAGGRLPNKLVWEKGKWNHIASERLAF